MDKNHELRLATRRALIRRFQLALALTALILPFLAWSSLRCLDGMFNMPPHWVPSSHPEREQFDWFCEQFESEAIIVISWPGCTIDDPRLQEFERSLTEADDPEVRQRHQHLFARVLTGYSLVRQLTEEPLGLSRSEAVDRLASVLVGSDRETSCAVIVLTDAGGYARDQARETLLDVAQGICRLDRDAFYLAGPPVDGVAIDRAAMTTMRRFVAPSALMSLALCWYCLGSWRYAVMVMAAAGLAESLVLSLVWWSGETMNAILILMPPLVMVLTVAAGVHLVNYYLAHVRRDNEPDAPQQALSEGWQPSVLAAATTGIGMASLLVSDIGPIRVFGGVSSVGIVAGLVVLLLLLPGTMARWPARPPSRRGRRVVFMPRGLRWLAENVIGLGAWITAGAILLSLGLGWGLFSIKTSVRMRDFFAPSDRVLRDYRWLEEHVGPMVPVEVLVHFPLETPLQYVKRVELLREIGNEVDQIEGLGGVMSAATFTPVGPRGWSFRDAIRRRVMSREIEDGRQQFIDAGYLAELDGRQIWRLSARAAAMGDVDYHQLLTTIRQRVEPLVDEWQASETVEGEAAPEVELSYTGAMPLIYQTQQILLEDLFQSFFTAFGVVAVVMMIVLRSVWAGLVAMIPNLFPTAVVLGLMGWLRIPIDIGTVMTASIALGVAVVDTLHFLSWFRREESRGRSRVRAIRLTYRHSAMAMISTSFICGLGMLVFVFSDFVPTQRFAWMVFLLLMAALAGDLIILPALLASPLGHVFRRSRGRAEPTGR